MEFELFSICKSQVKLGLWIDLTYTDRFYPKEEVQEAGVIYTKLQCRGHGECPSPEQVDTFIKICNTFIDKHGNDFIGVHCTHGFNRTGFLICSFLVREYDFSISAALSLFAKCRPPGIYKQDYINELWNLYKDADEPHPPLAPQRPDWCFEDEDLDDDDDECTGPSTSSGPPPGKRLHSQINGSTAGSSGSQNGKKKRRGEFVKENPTFMDGISGVEPVTDRQELFELQQKVQMMCGWEGYLIRFLLFFTGDSVWSQARHRSAKHRKLSFKCFFLSNRIYFFGIRNYDSRRLINDFFPHFVAF